MPHHLCLRTALGNFCQWLGDRVLRQTMTIISSSHSPWTLRFYGLHSIILTQVIVFPDWTVHSKESRHVIPFLCHLCWLNCTSCASERSHLSWRGRAFEMPHVRLSIYTHSYPETHTHNNLPWFSLLSSFLTSFFEALRSFQQTCTLLSWSHSLNIPYFSAYAGGWYI